MLSKAYTIGLVCEQWSGLLVFAIGYCWNQHLPPHRVSGLSICRITAAMHRSDKCIELNVQYWDRWAVSNEHCADKLHRLFTVHKVFASVLMILHADRKASMLSRSMSHQFVSASRLTCFSWGWMSSDEFASSRLSTESPRYLCVGLLTSAVSHWSGRRGEREWECLHSVSNSIVRLSNHVA